MLASAAMLLYLFLHILHEAFGYTHDHGYEKLLSEQRIINELIHTNKDYDYRVRPRGTINPYGPSQPVVVSVNMYLRSISKVDDVNMEYSLHFTFREEWVDERLRFNSSTLAHIVLSPEQKIWVPDTFFQNEKDGKKHNIDKPNVLIRVYNGTGRILYSCRLTLTLSCPMRLVDYPLDVQTCFIDFSSYAYTTQDIDYVWKTERPIQIKEGLRQSLPSFLLSNVSTSNCTSVTNTGVYACLRTVIQLKREFSYYLLQLYIPSFMLVAVSWVSFWLDKDSVPARVTLGVTTLLTMTTQASGVNANLPPVSYTKAIDIWIGVCLAFIFGALLEFALVNWAARQDIVRAAYRAHGHTNNLLLRMSNGGESHHQQRSHGGGADAKSAAARRLCLSGQRRRAPPAPPAHTSYLPLAGDGSPIFNSPLVVGNGHFHHHHQHNNDYYCHYDDVVDEEESAARSKTTSARSKGSFYEQYQRPPLPNWNYEAAAAALDPDASPLLFKTAIPSAAGAAANGHVYRARMEDGKHVVCSSSSSPPPPPRHHHATMAAAYSQQMAAAEQAALATAAVHRMQMITGQTSSSLSGPGSHHPPPGFWNGIWQGKYREHSRRIDLISRVMFPIFFILFNITYWCRYLLPYMAVEADESIEK